MKYRYQTDGRINEVELERQGDEFAATVAGVKHTVKVLGAEGGEINLLFDSRPVRVYWAESGGVRWLALDGCTFRLEKPATISAGRTGSRSGEDQMRAPMPAQVSSVSVSEGERVEKGQELMILEAMKMEIRLSAPRGGVVRRLLAENGQTVQKDQVLVEINAGD